jgi:DNA (cytosine-5)-methyltransferase 1
VDLFAGGGGLSLGLERAGYRVILAVDSDPASLATHNHNFEGPALNFDLSINSQIDALVELLQGVDIDLVAGGPPCQPFSRAGRSKIRSLVAEGVRDARDHRRELWRSYLNVVERVRPRAVLMENVPDMALADDMRTVRVMLDRLEDLGYDADLRLLDAWKHGVPQHRQRLIVVALRDAAEFRWPVPGKLVTVAQAINDLPDLTGLLGERSLEYRPGGSLSKFQRAARRGMNGHAHEIWDHITRPVRKDDREAFDLMHSGTRYSELPDRLKRYRDDIFDDKYKRLAWGELSRSITAHIAKDGYWYIHPDQPRTLSVREAARIQSFPDRFRFAGTRSNAFAQIGNAVPPLLGKAVAAAIRRATRRSPDPSSHRGTKWLRDVREHVLAWADADRREHPWRYPGDPWKAACGVLLGARSPLLVTRFLDLFPTPRHVDARRFRAPRGRLRPNAADAAKRLRAAAAHWSRDSAEARVERLRPTAAERTQLDVVVGRSDRIMPTAQALRVAARLTDADDEQTKADHRMSLGRLVGAGSRCPELSAVLHVLGQQVCAATDPVCVDCPLSALCPSAKKATRAASAR